MHGYLNVKFKDNRILHVARQNTISTLHKIPVSRTIPVLNKLERLRYKPEGRGFDSRWCHWNSSLT